VYDGFARLLPAPIPPAMGFPPSRREVEAYQHVWGHIHQRRFGLGRAVCPELTDPTGGSAPPGVHVQAAGSLR